MIDLFNKKKIKELQDEIDYQYRLLEAKNITINKLQNELSENHKNQNRILDENKKLIDWIFKILDNFGEEAYSKYSPVKIPYYKDTSIKAFGFKEGLPFRTSQTTIRIPELIINKSERIE